MSMKSTPFEFSEGYNLLMLNAEQGNLDEVKRIIQERKNLDVNQMNKKGYTSLALAVKSGNLTIVRELIAAGADVNIRNNSGQSPLFLASYHGFEDIARVLLANGSTINTTDQRGWTPLMIAVYHSSVPIARMLLDNNADANIKDYYGKSALDRAKHPELQRLISEKILTPRKPLENSNSKLHISSAQSPSAFDASGKQKKGKFGTFSTPSNQHNRSFDNRTPQSFPTKTSEPLRSRSRSQSQKKIFTPSKAATTSNGLRNTPQTQKDNRSVTSSNQKQNKGSGDINKLVSEQMDNLSQKIHNIITQRVNYEVPLQIQNYRELLRAEAENTVSQRLNGIISDMNNYFNLKLSYCLNAAGVDSRSIDLQPFLDSKEVQGLEIAPMIRQLDLDAEDFKRLEEIRNELEEMEADTLSYRVPANDQSMQSGSDKRADGFMSFGNRWQAKTELIDHINSELGNSAEYLINYSGDKISNLIREENQYLSKGLLSELSSTIDQLEDQIRQKFEDSINKRVSQISEALGTQPRNSSPFNKKGTGVLGSLSGTNIISSSREKLRSEMDNFSNEDAARTSNASKSYGGGLRSSQQDEFNTSKRLSDTRSKIQIIKDSLNGNFESPTDVLNESIKVMSRTAPNFSQPSSALSSNQQTAQKNSRGQDTGSKAEKEQTRSTKNLESTANFGQEKYNAQEIKGHYKSQGAIGTKQTGVARQNDQRGGVPPHRVPGNDHNVNYNFGREDGSN